MWLARLDRNVSKKLTAEDVNAAIAGWVRDLRYRSLKEEQKASDFQLFERERRVRGLTNWLWQKPVLHCLPGASVRLKSAEKTSIVFIVSPLVTLMKNQVEKLSKSKISQKSKSQVAHISRETDYEMARGVAEGRYQLVYSGPESLLGSRKCEQSLTAEMPRV